MHNIHQLDARFIDLVARLPEELPDGVLEISLETLYSLGLLKLQHEKRVHVPWHFFHVHDSGDKITLYNDWYVAWIVPHQQGDIPSTLVLIASDSKQGLKPELAFVTTGVYNSSKTVLKVLERYLDEIEENNQYIHSISKPPLEA
jgi:hypothetical protein